MSPSATNLNQIVPLAPLTLYWLPENIDLPFWLDNGI